METVKVLHAWASGWHSSQRHRSLGVCQHPLTALDVVPEHCCHVDVASCSVMVRQSHESIWGEGVPICLAKGAGYSQTQQCSSLPLSRHRAVLLLLFLCLNFLFFFFFICACFLLCSFGQRSWFSVHFLLLTCLRRVCISACGACGALVVWVSSRIFSKRFRLPLSTRKKKCFEYFHCYL